MRDHRERIIHSSLKEISVHQALENSPSLGVVVRAGHSHRHNRILADVCCHTPVIVGPELGEFIELEQVDNSVRAKLLELAEICKSLSAELIQHADRLESVAWQEELVDDLSELIKQRDSGVDLDDISAGTSYILTGHETATAKLSKKDTRNFVLADSANVRKPSTRTASTRATSTRTRTRQPSVEIDLDELDKIV